MRFADMVGRQYLFALCRQQLSYEERRTYARQVADLLRPKTRRRLLLLKAPWLLALLARLYQTVRPRVSPSLLRWRVSRILFRFLSSRFLTTLYRVRG